eukprot:COSAG02_NODE_3855_length_6141_cov_16.381000_7_plen_136_part_00
MRTGSFFCVGPSDATVCAKRVASYGSFTAQSLLVVENCLDYCLSSRSLLSPKYWIFCAKPVTKKRKQPESTAAAAAAPADNELTVALVCKGSLALPKGFKTRLADGHQSILNLAHVARTVQVGLLSNQVLMPPEL